MIDLEDSGLAKGYRGIFEKVLRPFMIECDINIVYMNPAYGLGYWNGEMWLENFFLFISHYDVAAPRIPFPWAPDEWTAWQYTQKENGPSFGLTTSQAAPYVIKEESFVTST
jgi:hypothetical protein